MKKGIFLVLMTIAVIAVMMTAQVSAKSKSGTSKVWAGVPLIGHVYVCTPWKAYYSGTGNNKEISKVTTKESYTSAGVALVSYSNYETWSEITSETTFEVYAEGHCDLVFKGCPISLGLQTFLAYEEL